MAALSSNVMCLQIVRKRRHLAERRGIVTATIKAERLNQKAFISQGNTKSQVFLRHVWLSLVCLGE